MTAALRQARTAAGEGLPQDELSIQNGGTTPGLLSRQIRTGAPPTLGRRVAPALPAAVIPQGPDLTFERGHVGSLWQVPGGRKVVPRSRGGIVREGALATDDVDDIVENAASELPDGSWSFSLEAPGVLSGTDTLHRRKRVSFSCVGATDRVNAVPADECYRFRPRCV